MGTGVPARAWPPAVSWPRGRLRPGAAVRGASCAVRLLSAVVRPLSAVRCPLSSVLCPLSSVLCPPSVLAGAAGPRGRGGAAKRSAVSTGRLSRSPGVHARPIDPVVSREPSVSTEARSRGEFHAYMPSAFIRSARGHPAVPRVRQPVNQRRVPPSPLVLGREPLRPPPPAADRDRPVSRRSKPSSRTTFIGEQPNPWELLHPQDVMSRHRGAKPPRRCERSEEISLLSPEYLLSVERRPCHPGPPDH